MSHQTILKYDAKFDAAHRLLHYNGPCHNLHGHTWKVELELVGEVDPKSGMLIDFGDIKKIVASTIMAKLDHGGIFNFEDKVLWQNLNSMGLKTYTLPGEPTCENIAKSIFEMISSAVQQASKTMWLSSVRVWESDHASAIADSILMKELEEDKAGEVAEEPDDVEEKENENEEKLPSNPKA